MEKQKARARQAYQEKTEGVQGREKDEEVFSGLVSNFVGYEKKRLKPGF